MPCTAWRACLTSTTWPPHLSPTCLEGETVTKRMTKEELLAIAEEPTTSMRTGARAFGVSAATFYEQYHQGTLPVRVLRIGRSLRIPTADLLRVLGIEVDRGQDEIAESA